MEKIHFFRPAIGESDIEAVTEVMKSGHLTMGTKVAEFEHEFAKYIGAKYCVATNSLTNGYMILLDYINPEWVMLPSMTFVSMANIPRLMGIKVRLRDNIHVGHAYSILTDDDTIWDSAHQMDRDMCKNSKDFWLSSFYANKSMTTGGEGGMIVCPDKESYQCLKESRDCGMVSSKHSWDYTVRNPGWYAYMTDFNAAMGLAQLEKLEALNMIKQAIVDTYNRELGESNTSLHLYTILVNERNKFIEYMEKNGVQCSVHYYRPIHKHPAFSDIKGDFPHTEKIAKKTVSLPLYPEMEYHEVKHICDLVNRWEKHE